MDTTPTVTIKLKPYLQEYLKCKLGEPVTGNRTFVGVMLRPFISYLPANENPPLMKGENFITIEIPWYDDKNVSNNTIYVSPENQEAFERILSTHFNDVFFSYMDDKVRYMRQRHTAKGAIKKCILQFCSDYNISYNHMNYEMFKKKYYRRGTAPKKDNLSFFSGKLSLTCPLLFLL